MTKRKVTIQIITEIDDETSVQSRPVEISDFQIQYDKPKPKGHLRDDGCFVDDEGRVFPPNFLSTGVVV